MLKDQILRSSKAKLMPIVVPEWDDVTVFARKLSISETNMLMDGKDQSLTFLASLVAVATTDDKGNRLFTLDEANELEFAAVQRVAEEILRWNGLHKDTLDVEKKD